MLFVRKVDDVTAVFGVRQLITFYKVIKNVSNLIWANKKKQQNLIYSAAKKVV